VLVAILLLFVLLGVGMGSVLASQVDQAAAQVPAWIDKLNAFTQEQFDTTVVSTSSATSSGQATQHVTQYLQNHAGDLLGAAGGVVGAVFSLFTVGLFTFYFTANGPQIRRVLLSRMPPSGNAAPCGPGRRPSTRREATSTPGPCWRSSTAD
jgi:predicted PurR-regulated permease PerM